MLNWKCHALVDVAHPFPTSLSPNGSFSRWTITSYPGHGVVYAMLTCESKKHYNTYLPTTTLQVWIDFAPSLHTHLFDVEPSTECLLSWCREIYALPWRLTRTSMLRSICYHFDLGLVTPRVLVNLRAPFLIRCWAQRRRSIILVALMNFCTCNLCCT